MIAFQKARTYAAELLRQRLIAHVVNKITFTEQCYYVLGEQCAGECGGVWCAECSRRLLPSKFLLCQCAHSMHQTVEKYSENSAREPR